MTDNSGRKIPDEPVSDEAIMAFADGEMPPDERSAVRDALASDRSAINKLESYAFTRGALKRVFDEVLTAPLPEKLLAPLREPAPATVTSLSERREAIRRASGWRAAVFSPVGAAAALLIGVGAGWLAQGAMRDDIVRLDDRGLVATASLQRALDVTPVGGNTMVARGLALRPKFTFLSVDKAWCRQYVLVRSGGLASGGLACREGDTWRVLAQGTAEAAADPSGKVVPAGKGEDLLDTIRGQLKEGDVLDRGAEQRVMDERWQTKP